MSQPTPTPKVGDRCKWKNQPERLVYMGRNGVWHQFEKVGEPQDMYMLELTKEPSHDQ